MRKTVIFLSSCIFLLLLGYTGYRGYQVWKQNHSMNMAKVYLAKGDMRSTILSLQQVLQINPRNIEACRAMAGLWEATRSPEAVLWRQRVLQLNPQSFDDRLALAQTALIFQDYPLVTNTLASVADTDKKTAAYQNIAGTAAMQGGQLGEAEAHFSECIRLDPSNLVPQVNLAVVRLHQTNALDMAEARIALRRVIMNSTNAILRSQARRELVIDAIRFNDIPTASTVSMELAEQTNAVFSDKLLRLNVLMRTHSTEFKPALALYQREAATDFAKLFDLSRWQMNQLSPADALGWLQSLPMQTQTNQTAALLAAQCQLQLHQWHELQVFIQHQNWNELEFMRHALSSRALREQRLTEASTAEWSVALNSAGQKASLVSLFYLAAEWKWNSEAEQILWTVVKRYPEEQWATAILAQALMTWHRTRSLMELFDIMHKRAPYDLEIENNLAMIAMLMGIQQLNPYNMAKEVYDKVPTNASYASTYAFSLYLQNKQADGLKVMQQLVPDSLEKPSIALYYGLILKANGKNPEAKVALNRVLRAQLLPEEQALFDQAEAGL